MAGHDWLKLGLRDAWLDQIREDPIDPHREIVDPHHHLFANPSCVYELEHLWADTDAGHNVVQTVFVECGAYHDMSAPADLQSVGETRHIASVAMKALRDPDKAQIAGIVADVDLRLKNLDAVLDAHKSASAGLLVGIRHSAACDPDPEALDIPGSGPEGLFRDRDFRTGLQRLGERGLTYDSWHYHHQNADFCAVAAAVSNTTMVLDHFGTPLGVGRYADKRHDIFAQWKDDIAAIAENSNVVAKLGGFAMPDNGWDWHRRSAPPSSDEVVEAQGAWYHHMIDCFGPDRCMFESNAPVDRVSLSYPVMWNAFKKIAAAYDDAAQDAMFAGTARRVYGLPL